MEFSREWFLDEVRDGFLVPSMMKKAWASSIRYYEKLRGICEKHGIRLFASWGTLISAIRHGGYIPWDDDLDLMILREDLEKLKEVLKDEPDIGEFHLQDYHATMGDNMFRQWLEKGVYIYGPEEWADRYGFPFGDVIDIFVLDHIPKDPGERLHHAEVIGACNRLQLAAGEIYGDGKVRDKSKENKEFRDALRDVERLTGKRLKFTEDEPIRVQILDVMDKHIASYASGHVDAGVADIANYLGEESRLLPKEYFSDYINVPYETGTMPVPIAYDSILRRYYGDFMMPQIDVNYGHDYPFYERYSDKLKEEFDFELLQYHFDADEYRLCMSQREEKVPLREVINATLELLKEAHAYILTSLRDIFIPEGVANDISGGLSDDVNVQKINEMLDLLGQCQTLVISLGSRAEVRLEDPSAVVGGLERYCEGIFKLYEQLCSGAAMSGDSGAGDAGEDGSGIDAAGKKAELNDVGSVFAACEKLLADVCDKEPDELREVLFICDRACHWSALHPIWEWESQKDGTHVTVIAMPHKYRDVTWIEPEGDWEVDSEGYPDVVKLTSYEEYNIADIHPDEIIFTFPYDAYSDVIAPHPVFYAQNMVRFADELVFIPPFELREIHDGDMRSRYTLGRFIENPGAVYADKIVVQSENMKSVFSELLSGMTDQIDWEAKVVDRESMYPGCEYVSSACTKFDKMCEGVPDQSGDCPDGVKPASGDTIRKKTLLVYFSGSMLYDHADAIAKINAVADLIEEKKDDIIPIWVSDPYAEQILKRHRPGTWREYEDVVRRISESDVWRIDDGLDIDGLAHAGDAFYGDAGVLMNKCRMLGKPVMWESPEVAVNG